MKRKMLARLTIPSATPARLMGLRSSMRNPCRDSCCDGVWSVSMGMARDCGLFFLLFCFLLWPFDLACAVGDRRAVESMLVAVVVQRHLSIPPRPIHRIHIRVKKYLIEVPYYDRQSREHGLIEVNGSRDIEPPARHVVADENLGPQHDSGDGHDDHAPHQGPVFSLLRVVEAGKFRLARSQAQIVADILARAPGIVQRRKQIQNQFSSLAAESAVENVVNAHCD